MTLKGFHVRPLRADGIGIEYIPPRGAKWLVATMRRNASARTTGSEAVGFTGVSGARRAVARKQQRRFSDGFYKEKRVSMFAASAGKLACPY